VAIDYRKVITIEPDEMGVRVSRYTTCLDYLASGMTREEVLADFPDLASDDLLACLAFDADCERRFTSTPA